MCIGRMKSLVEEMASITCTDDLPVLNSSERGKALVYVLAYVLDRMVMSNSNNNAENVAEGGEGNPMITKFHAMRTPSINIRDYLLRIEKYSGCSPECFVMALIYIDRFIQRTGFKLNAFNVHRIVITSIVLAVKFFDDQYFDNAYYAKVGGVPCGEMNSLELEFLFQTNFSLHVHADEYARYYNELANHCVFSNALSMYGTTNLNKSNQVYLADRSNGATSSTTITHYVAEDPTKNFDLSYFAREVVVPPPSVLSFPSSSTSPKTVSQYDQATTNDTSYLPPQCNSSLMPSVSAGSWWT